MNKVKQLRTRMKLTQAQMARVMGCGEKSVCRWEKGAKLTQLVQRNIDMLNAMLDIANGSYNGCEHDCLDCGGVNEIAAHIIRPANWAKP